MDESLLTNETDTNVTKETEASLSYDEYRQLALKKGHINIVKRKNFLEGKFANI